MPVSREYLRYVEAELQKEEKTWFEVVCNTFGKIPLSIPVSKETEKKVREQLEFTQTRVTVSSIYASAIMLALIIIAASVPLFILQQGMLGMMLAAFGLMFAYYMTIYPSLNLKSYRIRATSDLVLSILYLVISLRITPSLENALLFSAFNVRGPVGRSLKKIVWDLEIGKFDSADRAIEFYGDAWRQENEEFAEAIDIIRTASLKAEDDRNKMYEEAISILLERNQERMKRYTAELTMPVTLINYVGVMLPVMTIILFPIMTIFLSESIKPTLLVLMYNIVLPLVVYWLIQQTLSKRPFSFAPIDISKHPDAHRIGFYKIKLSGKYVEIPLVAVGPVAGALIMVLGFIMIFTSAEPVSLVKILGGLVVTWGLAVPIMIYSYFSYKNNIRIKNDIKTAENEFTEALYEFGLILSSGYSVETSLEKLLSKIKNLKIANLFSYALDRIKKFGMTLERAFFDREFGVVKYYPSQLIQNVLKILTESLHKGTETTAMSMMAISRYLKTVTHVEEYMKELMQESTSEMSFMLTIMVPVACAITIALAAIMTQIVFQLASVFANLTGLSESVPFSSPGMLNTLVDVKNIIPIEWFVLIVGIYTVEIVFILAEYLSKLQYGEDKIEKFKLIAGGLFKSMLFMTIITVFVYYAFSGLINLTDLAG